MALAPRSRVGVLSVGLFVPLLRELEVEYNATTYHALNLQVRNTDWVPAILVQISASWAWEMVSGGWKLQRTDCWAKLTSNGVNLVN